MEKFNFVKHTPKNKGPYKGGLNVYRNTTCVYVLEKKFPSYKKVDVYLDNEKNAIKIVEGDTYNITSPRSNKLIFSSRSLLNNGLKVGHYKYIGDNIFVLEDNN